MAKNGDGQNKKIADATLAFGAGLTCIIFSSQFVELPKDVGLTIIFLVLGFAGIFFALKLWKKV